MDTTFRSKMNNQNPFVFPIRDGKMIDARTLNITTRTRDNYFDQFVDVNFTDDKAELNLIATFMADYLKIHPSYETLKSEPTLSLETLQTILGYCVSGCVDHKVFFILNGPLNSGKSTLANIVLTTFEKYVGTISRDLFGRRNMENQKMNSALMVVSRVNLGFVHDVSRKTKLTSNDMRVFASGGEIPVTCREIWEPVAETFIPRIKIMLLCNTKPNMSDEVEVRARVRTIQLLNRFENSAENHVKIDGLQRNHKDAIFSWIVFGLKRYSETRVLFAPPPPPEDAAAATAAAAPESSWSSQPEKHVAMAVAMAEKHVAVAEETNPFHHDTLNRFIQECCVTEEKTLNPLTKRYKTTVYPINTFKEKYQNMYPEASVESLKLDMRTKGFISKMDSTGKISYFGIRPKTTDDLKAEADAKAVTDDESSIQAVEFDNDDFPETTERDRTPTSPSAKSVDQFPQKVESLHDRPSIDALRQVMRKRKHSAS